MTLLSSPKVRLKLSGLAARGVTIEDLRRAGPNRKKCPTQLAGRPAVWLGIRCSLEASNAVVETRSRHWRSGKTLLGPNSAPRNRVRQQEALD